MYIGTRKLREHQCPRTSRLSNIPFGEPHKNIAKFGGVEEGKSKMINKWVFRYPDFYSLWSAYETEALKKKHNVDLFRQKVTVQVQMGI